MAYILAGSFAENPHNHLWYGIVCRQEGKVMTVVALGIEPTRADVQVWIRQTVTLMRTHGNTKVQAPDMFERASAGPIH